MNFAKVQNNEYLNKDFNLFKFLLFCSNQTAQTKKPSEIEFQSWFLCLLFFYIFSASNENLLFSKENKKKSHQNINSVKDSKQKSGDVNPNIERGRVNAAAYGQC